MKKLDDKIDNIVDEKQSNKKNVKKEVFGWLLALVNAVVITILINSFIIFGARVPSQSMENTIHVNDRFFTYRLAYINDKPQRMDVITFRYPDDETKRFIKRVIGLPNETVKGINGKIYINDSKMPLKEDYIKEKPFEDFGPYTVPKNCYFMMGDNRNNSLDSRFWVNKFVNEDKILGKAVLKFYPEIKVIK